MMWSNWSDFWSMGGYGLFVWGSLGVCLLAMGLEVLLLDHRRRALIRRMRARGAGDGRESEA